MLISIQYLSSIMRKNITNQYKTSQVSRITSENIITLFSYWKNMFSVLTCMLLGKKIKTISKQVLISYSVRKIPPILFFYFYLTPSFEIVHLIGRRMRVIVLDDHCRNIWLSDLNFFLIDKRSAPLIESSSQKATETLFTE